ncbi:MAG: hypothetical protein ACRETO_09790 [Gammaproteobacteria bacterium]
MDSEYWRQRWKQGHTSFHLQDVNPNLIEFWNRLELDSGAGVLVSWCPCAARPGTCSGCVSRVSRCWAWK